MIKIRKGQAPAFLTDVNGKWYKETQDALTYYKGNPTSPFEFKHYKDKKLKAALKAVFKKCAYCDSRYAGTSDGDVEHFRPKLRVEGKIPATPGYYWLANDWNNLLLSCQHCNQGRIQNLVVKGKTLREAKQGKLDQFPLRPIGIWVSTPGPTTPEDQYRLLINPCLDDPEEHFSYDEGEAIIIGKTDMGKTSIDVYALQRVDLVDDRRTLKIFFLTQLSLFKTALKTYDVSPNQENKDNLYEHWEQIKRMTNKNAQFAGMARFFLKKFVLTHNIVKPQALPVQNG